MKLSRRAKFLCAVSLAGLALGILLVWNIGGVLVSPSQRPIGSPPPLLGAQVVTFSSDSGATLNGWLIARSTNQGVIILLHGVRSDRRSMVARAQWLSRHNYAVLLFDFQAHGESLGKHITFGFLESRDASAAVKFMQETFPGQKIGVVGVSLGAASALLAQPPLPVAALVLESSFPTIYEATDDRMRERFGWIGRLGTPLLIAQLKPRLGIGVDDLKPIVAARHVTAPKFFIAGTADPLTTLAESQALFAAAAEPKTNWWITGAAHVDMHGFAREEYEHRVGEFLAKHLR